MYTLIRSDVRNLAGIRNITEVDKLGWGGGDGVSTWLLKVIQL